MEDHRRRHLVRFVLKLAYNGRNYSGWQSQANGNTVQQELEAALAKLLRQKVAVMGCGRTDAGVHAKEFFAHLTLDEMPGDKFLFRLNNVLPWDISVYEIFRVEENFHARFSAKSRKYEYHLIRRPNPFLHDRAYLRYGPINREVMQEACEYLLQREDFKSFSKARTAVKTYRCHLMECYWEENNDLWIF